MHALIYDFSKKTQLKISSSEDYHEVSTKSCLFLRCETQGQSQRQISTNDSTVAIVTVAAIVRGGSRRGPQNP